ncbi:MAG TPA: hypothetical protein VMT52_02820 [Planctomycetota bacterium]|nr:hypothetical protein [Planctomycetota bacterium]
MVSMGSSRTRAVYALLFVSGAAALGVEVVAARILQRLLGSTSLAVACVLAGFLGGMGLGAYIGQRILRRVERPLHAYGLAELAALLVTLLFTLLAEEAGVLLGLPFGDGLVFLLVLILAVPWGAAFPFAVAAVSPESAPRRVRSLYGWNALGGSAGAVAAGLVGVPRIGEWGTVLAAAVLEAAAGFGAIGLSLIWRRADASIASRRAPRAPLPVPLPVPVPGEVAGGTPPALLVSFLFLGGLSVLYWESLWTRLLVLTVGATVYSLSIIASSVLLGIGLGSLLLGGGFLARHGGWALPAIAASILLVGYKAMPRLPDAYLAGARLFESSPLLWGSLGAGAIVFLPNFFLGCLFPWIVSARARIAGTLYAVNSAGAVLGAFVGGPLIAGVISREAAYRAGIAALASLGCLGAFLARPAGRRAASRGAFEIILSLGVGAGVLITLNASPLGRPWDPKRLLSGVYQWSRADLEERSLEENLSAREVLCIVEGREVIVSVERNTGLNTVSVLGNGKVEGSVPADRGLPSLADLPTQILLGRLPVELFHSRSETSVLLIGLGSGVTLGAVSGLAPSRPQDARVDVFEIEEAFLQAIRHEAARPYLAPFLPAALAGDGSGGEGTGQHLRFHFGDARRLLAVEFHDARWDAIVSQPSEPWIPGSAPLFTAEFFEEASRRLADGGVFFQWLQIYKLGIEDVRLLVRTFRRAFPQVFLIRPPATGNLILMGSSRIPALEKLLDAPVSPFLGPTGIEVPADRLAIFLSGPRGVDAWVGLSPGLPVNTDSRGEIQFAGARALHSGGETARENLRKIEEACGADTVVRYLPEPLRSDRAFARLLARRNLRLGEVEEALALLAGDPSAEAREMRAEAEEEARARREEPSR